ncbi:two-component system, chemotaxis family, response regulator CheB [Ketogulonicigenium robustum]|uniref:protein-glutamate methylesterase n=1 Tax=Ketogulonicigenium robustum TaxID=92947 RepID=A0A1W6P0B3_9RHOB|nr:CheB methylesterase domain-containing protein [Ketogulonicigenium robustum]ARO14841.1 two-component system, chemotaxis family, response regulator CheB [Ketogulonicigenium robustum]
MSEPLLLIVDADSTRRHHLIRACLLAAPGMRVAGAGHASEAEMLLDARRPQRIAVADGVENRASVIAKARITGVDCLIFAAGGGSFSEMAQQIISGIRVHPPASVVTYGAAISQLILIGASTGGIAAIEKILTTFPADCPPVLLVQHIRDGFAEGFVRRLDQILAPQVRVAAEGVILTPGTIHVAARSDRHLGVTRRAGVLRSRLLAGPPVAGHSPSVDVLFSDGAALAPEIDVRAALLTGMGADGANGMCAIYDAGGHTIAQDRDSSVVWGMPRMAVERGGVSEVLPLNRIAAALLRTGEAARAPAPLR